MYYPSQKEFLELSRQGNCIPVYRELLADLDTPVSAYFKIAKGSSYSFLLESVEGEEKVARYSFLAADPDLVIQSKGNCLKVYDLKDGKAKNQRTIITNAPLSYVRGIIAQYRFVSIAGLPRFCGGLIGYIGYDMVRFFEKLPSKPKDDLNLPDLLLILAKSLVIFDHLNHKMKVVNCVRLKDNLSVAEKIKCYQKALREIDTTVAKLQKPLGLQKGVAKKTPPQLCMHSNFTRSQFENIVTQAKKEIHAGEIIQVVLSQRFETNLKAKPFDVYRMLRALNPSPYMYYLNFKDVQIIGSSPELLVRCEDGIVETRPIAGTRPRGKDEKEDEALAQDLLKDPKEKAEHIMLVDLGRNDLGRVCQQGSIRVSEFMAVEKYSHVMHIVSNVRGMLKKGKDAFDVLEAAFPAGTLSGAPKIRAMEIIDELENVSRGPYGGCIGYFSFSGNLDSCITIRTIVVTRGKAYIQAGAGIVADSNPRKEYQETVNKAKAQMLAIEKAYRQFS
jgi:anthranilate synthase component 1